VTAYSPLARGGEGIFDHPQVAVIAAKHG